MSVYGWKVNYVDDSGDKPVKEVVVINVPEGESIEDMFGKFVETRYSPDMRSYIVAARYDKIGLTFIPKPMGS